jgi:hypothetical protein
MSVSPSIFDGPRNEVSATDPTTINRDDFFKPLLGTISTGERYHCHSMYRALQLTSLHGYEATYDREKPRNANYAIDMCRISRSKQRADVCHATHDSGYYGKRGD